MLAVGDTFPYFALKAVKGGPAGLQRDTAFTKITSATDRGKWKLVFFWPNDFSFARPTEIVTFGRMAGEFAARDTVVYGVSIDSEFVHFNWRLHNDDLRTLAIPMLADVKRELVAAVGVLDKAECVAFRATFLVDPDGIVRYASVNDMSLRRNPAEVLRVLDALQTGDLCPCDWQKGDERLRAEPDLVQARRYEAA